MQIQLKKSEEDIYCKKCNSERQIVRTSTFSNLEEKVKLKSQKFDEPTSFELFKMDFETVK